MESTNIRRLFAPVSRLGNYVRPGYNDERLAQQLLSEGVSGITGVIFSARFSDRQQELRDATQRREIDSILETESLGLSLPPELDKRRARLPWAGERPHRPIDLTGPAGADFAQRIVEHVAEAGYSAVLAPTHFVEGFESPWLSVDRTLAVLMRQLLDSAGLQHVQIFYPLCVPLKLLRTANARQRLALALTNLPIDAVWLRVHPFGGSHGSVALRAYVESAFALHQLNVPVVAERTGTIGLPVIALGAASGIEGGVGSGESFSVHQLTAIAQPGESAPRPRRIYVEQLGLYLKHADADSLLRTRGMKSLVCLNSDCCRRGLEDMLANSRRHAVIARAGEVGELSRVVEPARVIKYQDEWLLTAIHNLTRAARACNNGRLKEFLEKRRYVLEAWSLMIRQMRQERELVVMAPEVQSLAVRRQMRGA